MCPRTINLCTKQKIYDVPYRNISAFLFFNGKYKLLLLTLFYLHCYFFYYYFQNEKYKILQIYNSPAVSSFYIFHLNKRALKTIKFILSFLEFIASVLKIQFLWLFYRSSTSGFTFSSLWLAYLSLFSIWLITCNFSS